VDPVPRRDYLALGRVDAAVRVVLEATGRGEGEGAEMLCELAETLMRSGHEPTARGLWEQARAGFGDDVWVYVQAGIEYGDLGDHDTALTWLTAGIDLALRTGDPESALQQLVLLRAAALSATGQHRTTSRSVQGTPWHNRPPQGLRREDPDEGRQNSRQVDAGGVDGAGEGGSARPVAGR
jgi:hypothetical protein